MGGQWGEQTGGHLRVPHPEVACLWHPRKQGCFLMCFSVTSCWVENYAVQKFWDPKENGISLPSFPRATSCVISPIERGLFLVPISSLEACEHISQCWWKHNCLIFSPKQTACPIGKQGGVLTYFFHSFHIGVYCVCTCSSPYSLHPLSLSSLLPVPLVPLPLFPFYFYVICNIWFCVAK